MKSWQKYALDCFKGKPFYELPSILGKEYFRFATYQALERDTVNNYGPIASASLSLLYRPKVVVEFGVKAGFTSLLLCRFNPEAEVHGVDLVGQIDHTDLPTGFVVLLHNLKYSLHIGRNSWEFKMPGEVDLCFIDANHEEEFVYKDSITAWENRNIKGDWCIAWDDYHPSNPKVVRAMDRFCSEVGFKLHKIGSWHYIGTKMMPESELADKEWNI
uniref:Putative cephalosporin hydroxylase n=1 Tax=viral metagenome TaxID=1070528 RepID=A0A6M3J6J7_9ZZZZ